MKREFVSSSNLRSVGYDFSTKTLEVEFNNSSIYQYFGVPAEVYEGLLHAVSHGKFFHEHIRNVYPYQKVS